MNKISFLFFSLFLGTNTLALDCSLTPEHTNITCAKSYRAKSLDDVMDYQKDFKSVAGVAKNLVIDFDLSTDSDLVITTPCKVSFKKEKSHQFKNLCIDAKEGVHIAPYSTISANDFTLKSNKKIVIRDHAKITANDMKLDSYGDSEESRAHIRHHSSVSVNNLSLNAFARATLGHSSDYQITNTLNLFSKSKFSAIWKETNVKAGILKSTLLEKIDFQKGWLRQQIL